MSLPGFRIKDIKTTNICFPLYVENYILNEHYFTEKGNFDSRLSLSRLRLSRITAYLEEKNLVLVITQKSNIRL